MTKRSNGTIKIKPKNGPPEWTIVGWIWLTKSGEGYAMSFKDDFHWTPEMKATHVLCTFWY